MCVEGEKGNKKKGRQLQFKESFKGKSMYLRPLMQIVLVNEMVGIGSQFQLETFRKLRNSN